MPTEPIFSYAAAPQPVKPRAKYRNIGDEAGLTLMSDPRVRRGLTLNSAKATTPIPGRGASNPAHKSRTAKIGDTAMSDRAEMPQNQPTYSFEVSGFVGSEFDLDRYLVAPTDAQSSSNQNESCQTDEFVPLPPPAEYVPRKTGVDIYTQVEDQLELFDFDKEVQPMVDVVVKKTIEQALFELNSEDELKTLLSEIDKFNVEREAEARWILLKEKETIEDNKLKEKERHERQELLEIEGEVRRTVGAAAAMRQLLPAVVDGVMHDLYKKGIWKDEDRETACDAVLPVVTAAAQNKADLYAAAFDIVEELLVRAQEVHAEVGEVEHIKRKKVHVHITLTAKETGGDDDIFLGCFKLNPRSTLSSLEEDIQAKINTEKITIFSSLQKPLSSTFGKFGSTMTPGFELLTLDIPNQVDIRI